MSETPAERRGIDLSDAPEDVQATLNVLMDLRDRLTAAEARERALREALQRIIAIEQGEIATKEELALALNRCGDIAQDALAAALASPGTEGTDE